MRFAALVVAVVIGAGDSVIGQSPGPNQQAAPAGIPTPPVVRDAPQARIQRKTADAVTVFIPLNIVGIFDADFLNPRNPPDILGPSTNDAERAEYSKRVRIAFDNRASNRTFVLTSTITMPQLMQNTMNAITSGPYEAAQAAWQTLNGVKLDSCRADTLQCVMTITIQPHTAPAIPAGVFVEFDANNQMVRPKPVAGKVPPIEFKVVFFDEASDPAQSRGYFSVVLLAGLGEPQDKSTWSLVAQVGMSHDPDTGDRSTTFSSAAPYSGTSKSHVPGLGRLNIKQNLGSRADVDIDLSYKNADFGEKDQTAKLGASKFRVNVYALNGVTLSFGKFDFAAPTNAIAVKESGEGFRLAYRNLAFSHIVHRESEDGAANGDNRDNKSLIVEVNNISGLNWRVVRSVNFFASYGRERLTSAPDATPLVLAHEYSTVGTELFWDAGESPLQGSVAYYRAAANAVQDSGYQDTLGNIVYLTATYTFFTSGTKEGRKEVGRAVTGQFGTGSPRPRADALAYAGETQAFAPDTLFLKVLAAKILPADNVGSGVASKAYLSGTYSEQQFTPLAWIARVIGVPDTDIASRASIVQYHRYELRDAVNASTAAGHEFDVTFQIETPKGVKTSMVLSAFRPGAALKPILGDRWIRSIAANVSVKM